MSLQMVARYDPMDIKDVNEMMIDDCSMFFFYLNESFNSFQLRL